jgi:hypothetical protein
MARQSLVGWKVFYRHTSTGMKTELYVVAERSSTAWSLQEQWVMRKRGCT